jgi:hypothetical protein
MAKKQQPQSASKQKIDAIYDLRKAAERKGRIEHALSGQPSPERRTQLLESMLELEDKTATAIASCHECGHEHDPGEPHAPKAL